MINIQRIIRITVNIIALFILAFSIYFYITGDFFKANVGILSFLAILTPRMIYHHQWFRRLFHRELLTTAEVLITTALALNAVGAIWLYYEPRWISYDSIFHFFGPFLWGVGLTLAYVVIQTWRGKTVKKRGALLSVILIQIIWIFGWEIFEFWGDKFWGTSMSLQFGEGWDTSYDIILALISLPLSCIVIWKYFDYFVSRWRKHYE